MLNSEDWELRQFKTIYTYMHTYTMKNIRRKRTVTIAQHANHTRLRPNNTTKSLPCSGMALFLCKKSRLFRVYSLMWFILRFHSTLTHNTRYWFCTAASDTSQSYHKGHWILGAVSLNIRSSFSGILCTEKGAPKPFVKRPPGVDSAKTLARRESGSTNIHSTLVAKFSQASLSNIVYI